MRPQPPAPLQPPSLQTSDLHRQQQQAPSSRVNPRTATNGTQSNLSLPRAPNPLPYNPSDLVLTSISQTAGDSCPSVENAYFITHAQFRAWNPAVSEDCATGFWLSKQKAHCYINGSFIRVFIGRRRANLTCLSLDYDYCVGTTDATVTTRSISSTPTSTNPSVAAPTPNQPNNAISNCNRYAAAQAGDYCSVSDLIYFYGAATSIPIKSSGRENKFTDDGSFFPSYSSLRPATASVQQIYTRGTASWAATGLGATTCSGPDITTVWGFPES